MSFRLCSLILLSFTFAFSAEAGPVDFPTSATEKNAKKVRDEILGNEGIRRALGTQLQASIDGEYHDAFLQQIRADQFVAASEKWLKSERGVEIEWPENTYTIEKAKFLSEFVASIRPHNGARGNSQLGMKIKYFRGAEMREFLMELYPKENIVAEEISIESFETLTLASQRPPVIESQQTGGNLYVENGKVQLRPSQTLTSYPVEDGATIVGLSDRLDSENLRKFWNVIPQQVLAYERSPEAAKPQIYLRSRGGFVHNYPIESTESFHQLKKIWDEKGANLKLGFSRDASQNLSLFVHVPETFRINPAYDRVFLQALPESVYQNVLGANLIDEDKENVQKASEIYISSAEVAYDAYRLKDPQYQAYLDRQVQKAADKKAKEAAKATEKAAREARKQADEAARNARRDAERQAREAREAANHAARELNTMLSSPDQCEE